MPTEYRYKGYRIVTAGRQLYAVYPPTGLSSLKFGTLADVKRSIEKDIALLENERQKKSYGYRGFTISRTGAGGFNEWMAKPDGSTSDAALSHGLLGYGRTLADVKKGIDEYHEQMRELELNAEAIAILDALREAIPPSAPTGG